MADIEAKDLLKSLHQYHREIVKFAQQTTDNAQTLKDATAIVNSQKNDGWAKFKTLMPLIIVVVVFLAILLMKPFGVCEVSVSIDKGGSIKRCEQKTPAPATPVINKP